MKIVYTVLNYSINLTLNVNLLNFLCTKLQIFGSMRKESKLTVRENARIIRKKHLDYVLDNRGLGYELHQAMILNRRSVAQIKAKNGKRDLYGNLLLRCIRTAIHLLIGGITKEDVICQCSGNHMNSCVPIICSFFLGVRVALLDPSINFNDAVDVLTQIRPRIIFVTPDVVELIDRALHQIGVDCFIVLFGSSDVYIEFDEFLEPVGGEKYFHPLPILNLQETALILFTKGQTDKYKGVCLSHYALLNQFINTISSFNFASRKTRKRFSMVLSFTNIANYSEIELVCCCMIAGITKIICKKFDPTITWATIDKYDITFMSCTTSEAIQLCKTEKPEGIEGKSLKMVVTRGTSMSKKNLLEFRKVFPLCFISNCYGLAETTGRITMFNFTKPEDIKDQYEKPTSCGKLVPGMACKIVDPITERILGENQAGELCFKSDLIMNGYCRRDHSLLFDKYGWVKTGDVAFYDERHCFHVLNRLNDVFRCRNWDIIPVIIENVIKEHPAVKDAVVIGIYEASCSQLPMAVVTLNKGMKNRITEQDILNWANDILCSKEKLRAGLKIVKCIPTSVTGEPQRRQIREMIEKEIL